MDWRSEKRKYILWKAIKERNDFPTKNLVTFRSVPSHFEMELVPFQFHENCNEFWNDSFHRFVTNKSGCMCVITKLGPYSCQQHSTSPTCQYLWSFNNSSCNFSQKQTALCASCANMRAAAWSKPKPSSLTKFLTWPLCQFSWPYDNSSCLFSPYTMKTSWFAHFLWANVRAVCALHAQDPK